MAVTPDELAAATCTQCHVDFVFPHSSFTYHPNAMRDGGQFQHIVCDNLRAKNSGPISLHEKCVECDQKVMIPAWGEDKYCQYRIEGRTKVFAHRTCRPFLVDEPVDHYCPLCHESIVCVEIRDKVYKLQGAVKEGRKYVHRHCIPSPKA